MMPQSVLAQDMFLKCNFKHVILESSYTDKVPSMLVFEIIAQWCKLAFIQEVLHVHKAGGQMEQSVSLKLSVDT